ncbi:MAG: ATP-binding protein [Patescibacteria group bacterium]
MATSIAAPPPVATARLAPTATRKFSLEDVQTQARRLPLRMLFYSTEGFGKTSFGAQFPAPLFLMARGETGLETLIDAGQLPETPHFPEIQTWTDFLEVLEFLTREDHPYKTLVLDTLNGFERLCHEHVCGRDFKNDWGEHGFLSYQKGYELSTKDWIAFLELLDRLRETHLMRIVILCHAKVRSFKNPEGSDYDRYEPAVHRVTWDLTHKWIDIAAFGNYVTAIDKEGKGKGGIDRMLYFQHTAAHDAKHRHGLPESIILGNTPELAYRAFVDEMAKAANKNKPPQGKEKQK